MKSRREKPVPLPERAAAMLARLEGVRGLTVEERSVHALGLAATPQERWELFEKSLRSFGYWKPLKRNRFVTR